ncbi:MAG TPA: non-canonical purine NTP pyrophosphatase [Acetobacteraceae bacterium]|nr:non-canonical purine NTP pyrophosphatase [Acetobacteraceae bacterium]
MGRKLPHGTRLVLASHNPGKLAEICDLLQPFGLNMISAAALGLPEPAEDAPDFAGNARIKALAAAQASGLPALADDSGFSVAALDGAPGVHSARWAGPGKNFAPAMARVNALLGGATDRRAWFTAALCLGWPDGHSATFLGRVDGTAVWPPRGDKGFGYDPMFLPSGCDRTFGEMEPDAKHAVSHRARAFAPLCVACLE